MLTNVDLDHHTTFGSRAELEALFEEWLARVPRWCAGSRCRRFAARSAAGEHNRRNAACALAALELAGGRKVRVLADGAGRRLERRGERRGVTLLDDYAHHPT